MEPFVKGAAGGSRPWTENGKGIALENRGGLFFNSVLVTRRQEEDPRHNQGNNDQCPRAARGANFSQPALGLGGRTTEFAICCRSERGRTRWKRLCFFWIRDTVRRQEKATKGE